MLDNAVKYGKAASVTIQTTPKTIEIIIDDEGPGIPEKSSRSVFDPFYRLEKSRSRETGGVGLGLAIARSIVQAHRGEIVLSNRPTAGLRARIVFLDEWLITAGTGTYPNCDCRDANVRISALSQLRIFLRLFDHIFRLATRRTAAPASYQPRVLFTIFTTESMTGTSIKTPTTVARAAPELNPKRLIAAATANSKKLLAPISAEVPRRNALPPLHGSKVSEA